jgi:hypothetical protein
MVRCAFVALLFAAVGVTAPARPLAQDSDLDAFMARVIARRDENWKKLQQYILDEREHLRITGPGGARIYGFDRDYTWFIREGYFVRSPLKADGVSVGEPERTAYERSWLERERRRERRAVEREKQGGEVSIGSQGLLVDVPPQQPAAKSEEPPATVQDVLKQSTEPQFVALAYVLRFKFDPGHYALAGRERLGDRDVLRIEYYPSKLFSEGRTRPGRNARDRDPQIQEKMNKVSLVTLWIDPVEHQILQYTFENIDMDFMPGRSFVRLDGVKASMKMSQAFPSIWLPNQLEVSFGMTLAIGSVELKYETEYHDYRLAEVTSKIKPGPGE